MKPFDAIVYINRHYSCSLFPEYSIFCEGYPQLHIPQRAAQFGGLLLSDDYLQFVDEMSFVHNGKLVFEATREAKEYYTTIEARSVSLNTEPDIRLFPFRFKPGIAEFRFYLPKDIPTDMRPAAPLFVALFEEY